MPIYSDIDMELNKQADGDIQKDEDIQAIFNSLENIVMTIQGQRRMRPDFAYGPYNFLFESVNESNAATLGMILKNAINLYEDRIVLTNVNIEYDQESNSYKATVSFNMKGRGSDIIESVDFILKRL